MQGANHPGRDAEPPLSCRLLRDGSGGCGGNGGNLAILVWVIVVDLSNNCSSSCTLARTPAARSVLDATELFRAGV